MADQEPGGWPSVMASNHALALEGRDRLCRALDIEPPAPDSMIGSMATLVLPWVEPDDDATARLHDRLETEAQIQVPVAVWPVPAARTDGIEPQAFIRISAQRYNEPADYDRLADALLRMRPT
jgi:isopenicillin-N epimerase